ncbi:MAG TPA: hypothetical protein VLX92_08740 [Kofleriaceae bacterium]|nr:hypothetical protein [Kofleriaceae bacterium]
MRSATCLCSFVLAACSGHSTTPTPPAPDTGMAAPRCTSTPTQLVTEAEIAPASLGVVGVEVPDLAIDASGLYFNITYTGQNGAPGPTGHIMRFAFDGNPASALADSPNPERFAIVGDTLVWADDSARIRAVPLAGGSVRDVATTTGQPGWIASDGQTVYFNDSDGDKAVALAGGAPQLLTATPAFSASLIGSDLVLADFQNGNLDRMPAAGGTIVQLASGQEGPLYPQPCAGGSALCWIDGGTLQDTVGTLMQLGNAPGAAPRQLSQDSWLWHAHGLASDAAAFYLTTDALALVRVPAAGGAPEVLQMLNGDGDVVADDQCLYYSTLDGVFSLAKDAAAM